MADYIRIIQLLRERGSLKSELSQSLHLARNFQLKNRLKEIELELKVMAGSVDNAIKLLDEQRNKAEELRRIAKQEEAELALRLQQYFDTYNRFPRTAQCFNCHKALYGFDENICTKCTLIKCKCGGCKCNMDANLRAYIGE